MEASLYWIYLSPHFDDVVLSCGGIIAEQTRRGERVEIWTVCGGFPDRNRPLPPFARQMHEDLGVGANLVSLRRIEDRTACALIGASVRHGMLPDCIYRFLPDGSPLIRRSEDLWLPVHPAEMDLAVRLQRNWARRIPRDAQVVMPLSYGNHVDHRLTRMAAEGLDRPLWYYADFPYAQWHNLPLDAGLPAERILRVEVGAEALARWQDAIAAYTSQVERLFGSEAGMREQVEAFYQRGGGTFLWRR